jgi:hypothetical protein
MAIEPTAEQQEAADKENAIQARESFEFLTRHPDYINSEKNNNLLMAWIAARKLPWRPEALEAAFVALKDEFDSTPVPPPAPKPVAEPEFPWPYPLTAIIVKNMPRAEFRKHFEDARFRMQLTELKIRKGEI